MSNQWGKQNRSEGPLLEGNAGARRPPSASPEEVQGPQPQLP